ncbi:hypothetical protein [Yoonia sp. 67-2]|uniref:hypothetical protein n=1 Tax=Yoonia sp. 67-2 TaxID=3081448 RepID=UPI002B406446|nr:hypothetical protein [Yoonia sp. 67-2]
MPNIETIEVITKGQKRVNSVIYKRFLPTADQAEALQLRFYAEDNGPSIAGARLGGVLRGLGHQRSQHTDCFRIGNVANTRKRLRLGACDTLTATVLSSDRNTMGGD